MSDNLCEKEPILKSMRNKFLLFNFLLLLILTSCGDKNSYTIEGVLSDLENAEVLLLTSTYPTLEIDTVFASNGKFKYKNSSDTLQPLLVYLEQTSVWFTVWAKNGDKIKLSGTPFYPELIQVKGGDVNNLLSGFRADNAAFIKEREDLRYTQNNDSLKDSTASNRFLELNHLLKEKAKAFVKENPSSIAALIAIQDYVLTDENVEDVKLCLSLIEGTAKENVLYEQLLSVCAQLQKTQPGESAPRFSLLDTQKNRISIDTFKEHYLLMTFSASYCDKCVNVYKDWKEIRNEFPENQLKMLTVSLDEDSLAWNQIVKAEDLNWHQVIENKAWASSIVSMYNVYQLPTNYLIGLDGRILARNVYLEGIKSAINE